MKNGLEKAVPGIIVVVNPDKVSMSMLYREVISPPLFYFHMSGDWSCSKHDLTMQRSLHRTNTEFFNEVRSPN